MSRTDSDGSNSSKNRTIIRSESEKRVHKTTLPRIEETTNVSAGPTNSRRRSRLSDPIHQFRQRDLDHNLTQLHDKKSSNEHQKLFQTEQGGSPVNKQQEGLHSRRGLLTRKPSTDDIDVHVGRHEAWGESDNSNVTSSLPNSSVSNTPPMTEKEKRKKIFRRLRSKSFDNCFEDDRSPSPPSNPLPPQPDTTLRPSSVQRTRPSKIDPPKSQGSTSRPQSSPSRRSRTPSAIQSKKTKSSALESKSADQSEESSRRPSIRNPKSLLRSGSKDDINIAYNTGQTPPAYPTSADVSDVIIPSPILLRSVPQIFWRCRLNAMIHIYHHPYYNCLEIIALNLRTGEELPHIYIDLVRILEIMEEQVHKEAYAEKRSHRTQLLQTKSISCAIDYLLALLDANYQTDPATGQQSCVMNISRYNGNFSSFVVTIL